MNTTESLKNYARRYVLANHGKSYGLNKTKPKILVAVYGSLRKGLSNHPLLKDSKYLGTETRELHFKMYSMGGYPALILSVNPHPVVLEYYAVDEETFHRLDVLEGYPRFYNRMKITTDFGEAWLYFMENRQLSEPVESGDWKEFYAKKFEKPVW